MRVHKPFLLALPALMLTATIGPSAFASGTSALPFTVGFTPGSCPIEPPAELLALADWPLDAEGCAGTWTAATVVEAHVRSVTDILASVASARLPAPRTPDLAARGEPRADLPSPPVNRLPTSADDAPPPPFATAAVDASTLDAMRGGFDAPGGLRLSFGIERVVIINGVLESSTHVRVEDLGAAIGGGAGTLASLPAGATVAIIQNGPNNTVSAALPASMLGTIVQNSLDNQKLETVTTINATVNSAAVMRGMRLQQSLQEALNRASLLR